MAFSSSVWGGSIGMRRRPLAGMARRRRTHRGKGFFGDLWSGIKKKVYLLPSEPACFNCPRSTELPEALQT